MIHSSTREEAVNQFFVRALSCILLLRLGITVLLSDDLAFIKEALADLIIAGLIFAVFLGFIAKKHFFREPLTRTPFDGAIVLILSATALSLMHSACLAASFKFFVVLLAYVLFFYMAVDCLRHQKAVHLFLTYFALGVLVVMTFAVYEYFGHFSYEFIGMKRIGALFGFPNMLAAFVMLALPYTWALWFLAKDKWHKIAIAVLAGLLALIFLSTLSFLCTSSFFIGTTLMWALVWRKQLSQKANRFLAVLLMALSSVFLLFILFVRTANLSLTARLEYLKEAWQLILQHPILGTGADTFSYVSTQFVTYELGFSAYVHNSYLQWWVELGVLGLAAGIFLVWTFVKNARQALRNSSDVLLTATVWALAVFFIDNLTNFTLLRHQLSFFAWTALAVFCALQGPQDSVRESKRFSYALLGVMGVILVSVALRMSLSLMLYQQGVTAMTKGDYTKAKQSFVRARELDPTEDKFSSALGGVYLFEDFAAGEDRHLDQARASYEQAVRLSPYAADLYQTLGEIARKQGNEAKAALYFKKALQLAPLKYSKPAITRSLYVHPH